MKKEQKKLMIKKLVVKLLHSIRVDSEITTPLRSVSVAALQIQLSAVVIKVI